MLFAGAEQSVRVYQRGWCHLRWAPTVQKQNLATGKLAYRVKELVRSLVEEGTRDRAAPVAFPGSAKRKFAWFIENAPSLYSPLSIMRAVK